MTVRSIHAEPIPVIRTTTDMSLVECSSALTKMTATLYQNEINAAKHGKSSATITAVETILKDGDMCFGVGTDNGVPTISTMSVSTAAASSMPYTKLEFIAKANSPSDLLDRAVMVTIIVEKIDGVKLTVPESL